MGNRNRLSLLLVLDILAMAVLYLIPDEMGDWQVKKAVIILLVIAALILIACISGKKEKEMHAQVTDIEPASQINPAQYLSKGGPVCAGSDGRYHVTFLLKDDDTRLVLSLSAKQAGSLARGMYGTLIHNGPVFTGFIPE